MNELMTNYDHNLGKIVVFFKFFYHILYNIAIEC